MLFDKVMEMVDGVVIVVYQIASKIIIKSPIKGGINLTVKIIKRPVSLDWKLKANMCILKLSLPDLLCPDALSNNFCVLLFHRSWTLLLKWLNELIEL